MLLITFVVSLLHKEPRHNRIVVGIFKFRKVLEILDFHPAIGKNIVNSRRIVPKMIRLPKAIASFFKTVI
jgi:hypothetical protein